MPSFEETVDFDVKVIRNQPDKENAILLEIDGDEEKVWIPRSQIDDESDIDGDSEAGNIGTITVSEWIAVEKGLV